jgi:amino acid transporter
MGYAQELARRMSGFSNFAISFSIICILAGGITSFPLAMATGSGFEATVGWVIGGVFALVVAASLGQIGSAYPTAGGLYHWSSILGGRGWGWATAWINLLGLIFLMLLQPVGGIISDRVGRKPLLVFFGIGGVLYTYVLLTFLPKTTSPVLAFALTAVGYVIITGYTSVNAIVKAEVFPAEIRALGVGLGYALANSIFGGTAPLLYSAAQENGKVTLFIVYVTVLIGLSLLTYIFFLRNKAPNWLEDPEEMAVRRDRRSPARSGS